MSAAPKAVRETVSMLRAEGFTVIGVEPTKRHYKVTIQTPAGPRFLITQRGTGDPHSRLNLLRDARRLLQRTLQ